MRKAKILRNLTELTDDFEIKEKKIDRGLLYNGNYNLICNTNVLKDEKNRERPLAATIIGLNNTRIPLPVDLEFHDSWTDADAQECYLSAAPKGYVILGKPGLSNYSLGEAISKKYNCIHLCPKNLIIDEIEQKSATGKCIDFNMRHNKICNFDIILSILKRKLQSASIKHRGYVISGFPLVTSRRDMKYKVSTVISEESLLSAEDVLYDLIYNLKRKKEKSRKRTSHSSISSDEIHVEEEAEEEQEHEPEHEDETEENEIVELPKFLLDPCSNIVFSTKTYYIILKSFLLQQVQTLFDFRPDIVIYISCPNNDTVTKRSRKYINYMTGSKTFHSFTFNIGSEIRWPPNYVMSDDYKKPFDTHIFNPKYNCQQPTNFRENVVKQICNFKDHVFPYLENKLKEFDPKSVIKLDGRISVHQMMYHTMERLFMLPMKSILIPEPLYLDDPPEDIDDFWKTVEELNVIRSGNINFNRYASLWYNRCPVELAKRRTIQGKPKFAVILFKHIYLMSSLEAMILFCRNPRPYLKLKFLEPTCRIITTGTKTSGKTLIAKCLSWLFDTPIICYNQFLKDQKQNKYFNYSKTILSEIIATIEDKRFAKWERAELERISNLNTWFNTVSSILNTYIPLLKRKMNDIEEENLEEDAAFTNKYTTIRTQLSFLPMLDDLDECRNILKNKNLLTFAPLDLITELNKPSIPALGDQDVSEEITAYITANDLLKEIEPTVEELMNEIIKILIALDDQSLESLGVYGKYIIDGFPSNPEYWEFLSDRKLLPDYTIALIENREIDIEIMHHYENIENSAKNYQERYLLATDTLVKTKLLNTGVVDTTLNDIQIIVENITTGALYSDSVKQVVDPNEKNYTEIIQSFTESIERFREDWESVKLKLDDNLKSFIEVEIEEKNDVQVVDEVLLKVRKSYCKPCIPNEDEGADNEDTDDNTPKNLLTYNESRNVNETNVYCPIAFYDYGVIWEGKQEFSVKCDNKNYYFCKEECCDTFQKDPTKYQFFDMPTKKIPAMRICVIGSTGSGKTSVAKRIAKELGLIHVDFADFINNFLVPKHFKKVGWQYENSFTDTPIDEEVTEFQLDEENLNLVSDILSNEQELRRMINNYFEHGVPLVSILMQKLIETLWFKNPFQYTGIVIDGYPKLPADVEDMLSCFCIPDLVIELEGSSETTLERLSSKYLRNWKTQLNVAKIKAGIKLQKEQSEWLHYITKNIVVKLIIDDVLTNMFKETAEPFKSISAQSTIIDAHPSGSSNVDANLFATFNEFILEYPEPIDQNEWEKADDIIENINARLESYFETDDENIQTVKDSLLDQKIKVVSIDGKKTLEKVFRKVLLKLSSLRNRCDSFLEQTFIVNCDIAEMLLLEGFFLISKFYRMCPVHIFENPCSVSNLYSLNKRQSNIFPVIHRSYVYFMSSEKNVIKFRRNPLKYILNDAIKGYRQYPLRIGVIGPPKSGKSNLASKLAKRYGLMCVSKGMALRYVLENLLWSDIGSKIVSKLQKGECVDNELIMKAVLIVLMDHRIMTRGYVLDSLPDTPFEASELMKDGIFPLIVFDLNSDLVTVLQNSQSEFYYDILKRKPPYPLSFIKYRYSSWHATFRNIRDWIYEDTQNIHSLNGNNSKWQCFLDAYNAVESLIPKIHYYLTHVDSRIVLVDIFGISNETFKERMSVYKNLCPVCLRKNILRNNGFPPDKKGVVQYKNLFYWICADHLIYALTYPAILEIKDIKIPDLPVVVKHVDRSLIYENGTCLVTYAENLPSQMIIKGRNKFAASYKGKIYIFCSYKCLNKFLSQPHMYFDITVFKEMDIFPKLSLKQLPNLGYLEQTVGNIMTEACCAVNVLRPKYPGLDSRLSALLYVALYLKTHNPLMDKSMLSLYKKALNIFEIRSKMIVDIGLRLRSMDNPFAAYPKCCAKKKASRVPVPDERFDYLCEYHKPASKVPAFLNVVDIAGLVRGAAEGQGLGNAFLSHIKACDAIFNLCRAFDDEDVIHVDGDVNPVRDLETIGEELRLKDEEQLLQHVDKLDRVVNRGNDKKLKPEYDSLMKIKAVLTEEKKHIRFGDWSAADIEVLNKYLFLTSKPALYLVNLSEKDYIRKKNKWLPKLKEWIDKNDPGAPLIPFSGVFETKLLDMEPGERQAYLKENNLTSALDKIITLGYKALQLEYFFTAGADEVKAWTIQKGTKAPQAAGRIHTDFEKGFIMAEVMHYKDFKEEGSEAACKSAGKYRQQGRNYMVEDGDIIFFKFNAGAGLKDPKKK